MEQKTVARFMKTRKNLHSVKYPKKPFDEILEYLRFTKVEPYMKVGTASLKKTEETGFQAFCTAFTKYS